MIRRDFQVNTERSKRMDHHHVSLRGSPADMDQPTRHIPQKTWMAISVCAVPLNLRLPHIEGRIIDRLGLLRHLQIASFLFSFSPTLRSSANRKTIETVACSVCGNQKVFAYSLLSGEAGIARILREVARRTIIVPLLISQTSHDSNTEAVRFLEAMSSIATTHGQ